MSIVSVSSDSFDLLFSDSSGVPIFCTFREATLPPLSRNEVRNENTLFLEVSSEICNFIFEAMLLYYKPAIDPPVCACVLDAATFAGMVGQLWMCVWVLAFV